MQLELFEDEDGLLLKAELSEFQKDIDIFCSKYFYLKQNSYSYLEDRLQLMFFRKSLVDKLQEFKI